MSKKLTPDFATVRKLTEKYSVQIEITFGERFRTIVSNNDEIHIIKCGWDQNLIEEIKQLCVEMKKREDEKMVEITKRLESLDTSIFPDDLYEDKK
jgi:tRNA(Phe) wybutosine-synthesizing methylase Tyw3